MRLLVLSNFHSNKRFQEVYDFLKKEDFIKKCKADKILVNGNMLGVTESAPGYGCKYKHDEYLWDMDKRKLFMEIAPETAKRFVSAINDATFEKSKPQLAALIKSFVEERYTWVLNSLRKLSKLKHTYFNFGEQESPLHFLVIDELALILGLKREEIMAKIDEEELQEIFGMFKERLEQLDADERFTYLS
ncbi:MAG: hypothetical protein ABIE94_04690, partial [archaeon]